jgi:hypothetical protein
MTRNTEQLTRTALAFLRQARDSGITDDDEIIAEAARLMGHEHLALIGRTHARHFKTFNPN